MKFHKIVNFSKLKANTHASYEKPGHSFPCSDFVGNWELSVATSTRCILIVREKIHAMCFVRGGEHGHTKRRSVNCQQKQISS